MSNSGNTFLSIEDQNGFQRTVDLKDKDYSIGRRSQYDISFPSETSVSRHHADILFINGQYELHDRNSTFGTFCNGKKIKSKVLRNGDQIVFGKCKHIKVLFNEESKIYDFSSENFEMIKNLLQISKALNSSLVLDQVLQMVMTSVMEVTSAERGFLMLKEENNKFNYKITQKSGNKEKLSQAEFKISESVIENVKKTGKSLIIRDVQDDSWLQTQESIISLELRSIMCVPLKISHFSNEISTDTIFQSISSLSDLYQVDEEIIGIVYVDSKASNKSFTHFDLEILESLCSHAAISLHNSRLINELEKSEKFSSTLVDASRILNSTLDIDELLQIIINLATKMLDSQGSTLYLLEHEQKQLRVLTAQNEQLIKKNIPLNVGVVGKVIDTGAIINLKNPFSIKKYVDENEVIDRHNIATLLCVPLRDKDNKIIGSLETINKIANYFDKEDEQMLSALAVHASLAIENAMLHKEVQEKRKLEQELTVASEIQKRFLPDHSPKLSNFDIDAFTVQCKQVGGDYYDFIPLENGNIAIAIADISGKGIPASLMMANLQAALQSQAIIQNEPSPVVSTINKFLFRNSTANKYATFCYGILDPEKANFTYTNAGHNPPLLRRFNGNWEELTIGGMVVGLFDDQKYEQTSVKLEPGDILVLFSDGVSEAMNAIEEEFETIRLKKVVENYLNKDARQICEAIYDEIKLFEAGTVRHDDLTLLMIKAL